jgi:hypothetical protein
MPVVGDRALAEHPAQVIETADLKADQVLPMANENRCSTNATRNSTPRDAQGCAAAFIHDQREVGMTRTDIVASSRPRNAGAMSPRAGSSRVCRRLSVVPIALLLAAALFVPSSAVAAESTSGYSQTVPTPKTTPSTTPATTPTTPATTPTTGTSPSKEEKTTPEKTTPAAETSPTSTTPTATTSASKEKASTLPFTGFDLRWSVGIGAVLIGAGLSLAFVERRRRTSR